MNRSPGSILLPAALLKAPLALLALAALSGCGTLKPWVSPYERSDLADPIMSFSRAPADASYMHHVHQAREGARGAEGGGGGGCGCN